MLYTISNVTIKNNDWKIVDGMGVDGTPLMQASVNRTNKKGETFPNFDGIIEGARIEGEPWTNDAGKQYLFPPRVAKPKSARGTFDASVVMERKNDNIRASQDRKDESIKTSSTFRDASALTVALMTRGDVDADTWQAKWLEIRAWLASRYDDGNVIDQVPF